MGGVCTCFRGVTRMVVNTETAIAESESAASSVNAEITPADRTPLSWAGTVDPDGSPYRRNWCAFEEAYAPPEAPPSEQQ